MKLTWVKNLTEFRAHPATQPDEDGNPSVLIGAIDARRTPVVYGDNESLAMVSDLSGGILEAIEANPDIVQAFDLHQLLGDPDNQAVDEDGNKLWTTEEVEVTTEYQEVVGSHEDPVMIKVKQLVDGWSSEMVEQDVLDDEGNVIGTKMVEQWTYSGEPAVNENGDAVYPPRYEWVDVQAVDIDGNPETQTVYEYETRTRTETVTRKVPVLDPISPDPAVLEIYNRIYPRTPYDVTDEDGTTRTVTPPFLFGFIDGHL